MSYVYDLNTTMTGTMATATETGDTQSKDMTTGLKAKVRLTPTGIQSEFLLQLEEPLDVQGNDENGNLVSQPVRTEVRESLKRPVKVQQSTDGAVTGVQFPATFDGLSEEEIAQVKNALRAVAGLFDIRLIQQNATLDTVAEDVSGKYRAHFQRGADNVILRAKLNYTEYAPGSGLFDISDGNERPVPSTLAHTGEARIQLSGNNRIQSLVLSDSLRVAKEGASNPNAEFSVNGTNQLATTMNLQTQEPVNVTRLKADVSAWGPIESLRAEMGCRPAPSSPSQSSELVEKLADLGSMADPAGQGIHLACALRESNGVGEVAEWLRGGRLSAKARQETMFALGMVGTPEAQNLLLKTLQDRTADHSIRAQALLSLQAQARPSRRLLEGMEDFAFQSEGAPQDLAKFALGSLVGKAAPGDAFIAERVIRNLSARLLLAKRDPEKQLLVAALAASRLESAVPMLEMAAEEGSPQVRASAIRGLESCPGERAKQGLARARNLVAQSRFAAVAPGPDTPLRAARNCTQLAQELGFGTSDKFKCLEKGFESGDLGFIGAYGGVVAGAGCSGTWQNGFYAAARAQASVGLRIIGMDLDVFGLTVDAAWHTADASKRRFDLEYGWFGTTWPKTDWYSAVNSEQTGPVDMGGRGVAYKWCGPIGPFLFCIEVGVKLDYGIEKGWSGQKVMEEASKLKFDALNQSGDQRALYYLMAPYGSVTAYVEGRVSFVCLRLKVRLQGKFLIHKYPIRLVLDFHDATHANDLSLVDVCLLADEQRQSWLLQLIGTFDYCIGSKSKVLWQKGGPVHASRILTRCGNTCDLAIKDFNWSVEKPSEGTPLVLTVSATNLGPQSTAPFTPVKGRLFVDGVAVKDFEFKDGNNQSIRMFPQQNATTTVIWDNPIQGNHTITIKLDNDDIICDANQNNNAESKSIFIHPRMFDFVVSKIQSSLNPDNSINLIVECKNIGSKYVCYGISPVLSGGMPLHIIHYFPVTARVLCRGNNIYEFNAFSTRPLESLNCPQSPNFGESQGSCEILSQKITIPAQVNGFVVDSIDIQIDPDNQYEEVSKTNNSTIGYKFDFVAIDSVAPSVSSLSANGSIGQIPLCAAVSDAYGLTKVEYYVDGILRATAPIPQPYLASATYTAAFDSSLVSDGVHSLFVKAYDPSGNIGVSPSVSFEVKNALDKESPSVSEARVQGTGGNISFSATAKDNVAVRRLEFQVDGQLAGTLNTASGTIWKDSAVWADGSHSLVVKAFDAMGNMGAFTPVSFEITNDSKAPVVSVSVGGTSGNIPMTALASDNLGVAKVEFLVDGVVKGTVLANSPFPVSGNFTFAFPSTQVANGAHTLTAKVYDRAGNAGCSPEVSFNVANVGDLLPPTLSNLRVVPKLGGVPKRVIGYTVSVVASDNVGVARVRFLVDGELAGISIAAPYQALLSGYIGPVTITAVAYDAAGNQTPTSIQYEFPELDQDPLDPRDPIVRW